MQTVTLHTTEAATLRSALELAIDKFETFAKTNHAHPGIAEQFTRQAATIRRLLDHIEIADRITLNIE